MPTASCPRRGYRFLAPASGRSWTGPGASSGGGRSDSTAGRDGAAAGVSQP